MRKSLLLLLAITIAPALAHGQGWQDMGPFPDATTWVEAMHGVAVDGAGKVWLQPWAASVWVDPATGDTVKDGSGAPISTRALYVYNSDGTVAMNPIRTITVGAETDTLTGNLRGLRRDHNGDILVASGAGELWRINHQTGDGMNKELVASSSLSAPGVDANGFIYTANVVPGNPIKIYSPEFAFQSNAVDSALGFSRSFEVSADGNTIYWAGYSNGAIQKYTRASEFDPFGQVPDTLFRGMVSEAMVRHPVTNHIWVSNAPAAGTNPFDAFGSFDRWLKWYGVDLATDTIVDSLKFTVTVASSADSTIKARGISFAPDGMTAYAVIWDNNSQPSVRKFAAGAVGVEPVDDTIPKGFALEQNYPNPFNPTTNIEFSLASGAMTTLSVYDVLGRQVAVLVNEPLPAGNYKTTFDASNLASGTYLYILRSGTVQLSGNMTLLK